MGALMVMTNNYASLTFQGLQLKYFVFLILCSYNVLKAWMQKDNNKPLRAEKHLIAGAIAGTVEKIGKF